MDSSNQLQAKKLLAKYRAGECSEEELSLLENWYNRFELEGLAPLNEVQLSLIAESRVPIVRDKVVPLWKKLSVAAVLLVSVGLGLYFYRNSFKVEDTQVTVMNDIAPGENGATLTLANGRKILVNEAHTGKIAAEVGVKISKKADGQIVYEISSEGVDDFAYNTLSTSRGQQSQVRLPDGSVVFLNAESSLRYPVSLASSSSRKVELTGEGYFEVAKLTHSAGKARVPFFVKTFNQQVEVLGTHFNVSAYPDEPFVRTTLLEGSVRVASSIDARSGTSTGKSTLGSVVLVPGEQAVLSGGSGVPVVSSVDVATAVAWKDGQFVFADEPLESIMRKVSRWYNVEVVYENVDQNQRFGGGVSRFENVSTVLKKLELTGGIHFKVEGRRITVSK